MLGGYILLESDTTQEQIIEYSQVVNGTKIFSNYFWLIVLFTFGVGFLSRGLGSF